MRLLRRVLIGEGVFLAACGLLCLFRPDLIGTIIEPSAPADTYTRRALGIALIALSIPAFLQLGNEQAWLVLAGVYCFLFAACSIALVIGYVRTGFGGLALFWWPAVVVLCALAMAAFASRVWAVRQKPKPASQEKTQPEVDPPIDEKDPKAEIKLKLHDAKMRYAWNWFQYHADQRLKGFNFFLVLVGVLVAAYGAAMKESASTPSATSYRAFAIGIALFGAIVSVSFLIIEVRNTELVACGRGWLDRLEGGLSMTLRRDDHDRKRLHGARGPLFRIVNLPAGVMSHSVWIRVIYVMAVVGFLVGFVCALWGF